MLSGGLDVSLRTVHHDYTKLSSSRDINIVNTNTCSGDNLEILGSLHQLRRNLGLGPYEKGIIVSDYRDELFGTQTFPLVDLERLFE